MRDELVPTAAAPAAPAASALVERDDDAGGPTSRTICAYSAAAPRSSRGSSAP